MIEAMDHFRDRRIEYARLRHRVKYERDLETDYLKFLGDTQLLAKKTEAPEMDFKG